MTAWIQSGRRVQNSATKLFIKKGFTAISMDEIAKDFLCDCMLMFMINARQKLVEYVARESCKDRWAARDIGCPPIFLCRKEARLV
jgi:hypothetical protein